MSFSSPTPFFGHLNPSNGIQNVKSGNQQAKNSVATVEVRPRCMADVDFRAAAVGIFVASQPNGPSDMGISAKFPLDQGLVILSAVTRLDYMGRQRHGKRAVRRKSRREPGF